MKIIIVGGVAGGATLAARLRRNSEIDEIIMFEKDEYIAFANCGLPYYIGGVIEERSKLFIQTVEGLSKRYNLDIRNNSKVIRIDEENKQVEINNNGRVYFESYDKLVLSPGADPINPGFSAPNLFTLRNIPDTDKIKNYITNNQVKNAVVIGGGFIGVEMAENLNHLGINVTLVENSSHILKTLDSEMAAIAELNLKNSGVNIILNNSAKSINGNEVVLDSNHVLKTDMTILAIGVKPQTELVKGTSIELTSHGAFKVNNQFQTSVADIYAIGDAIETKSPIIGEDMYIALAWPANRQARILADIIHGSSTKNTGSIGTSVLKVNDLTVASTGLNEEYLNYLNIKNETLIVHRASHASYYPGSSTLTLKLVFDPITKKIFGAQAIGLSGVEKRIDMIATAIRANLLVDELPEIEVCYAPPFNSAKDPVNIAGYVASNIIAKKTNMVTYKDINNFDFVIDVRSKEENEFGNISGSLHHDLDMLRGNPLDIDRDAKILLYCQVGMRGYLAEQILKAQGFKNVSNLSGGYATYNYVNKNKEDIILKKSDIEYIVNHTIDARTLQCPGPITATFNKINEINVGETLEVLVTDFGFCQDIEAWCNKCGHTLVDITKEKGYIRVIITKSSIDSFSLSVENKATDNGTIVLFSGDMDKALGAMIIAQGAQVMGKQMTIFCTFWGLNVLRKDNHVKVEKTLFEKLFGFMMPRGAKRATISQINMMGIGTKMIKGRMKSKNVEQLPEMILEAQASGVKFIACTMSMDLMGIKEEELIDGVEFAGVAKYVGESSGADLTLFI